MSNEGTNAAEDSEAILLAVEPFRPHVGGRSLERPVTLKWAHEPDYHPVRLEPKEQPRKLDLFYTLENDPRIHFFFHVPIPLGFSHVFDRRAYRVKVRVRDASGSSSTQWFEIVPQSARPDDIRVRRVED